MAITVEQKIPINSRGFFLRERDAIKEKYGVEITFPRGRQFMHGDNQTMKMVGRQSKINEVMPKVRSILSECQEHYLGYKTRQERRRTMKVTYVAPSQSKSEPKKKRVANIFSGLDGLSEKDAEDDRLSYERKLKDDKMEQAIVQGFVPKPSSGSISQMNFALATSNSINTDGVSVNKLDKFNWGEDTSDDDNED